MKEEVIDLTNNDEGAVADLMNPHDAQHTADPMSTQVERMDSLDGQPARASATGGITAQEYASFSIYSAEFAVDRHGLVTDRQYTRRQLVPFLPIQSVLPNSATNHNVAEDEDRQSSPGAKPHADEVLREEALSDGWEEIGNETLHMARGQHDKPRRLLSTSNHGLFAVTLRGAIQCMNWDTPRYSPDIYVVACLTVRRRKQCHVYSPNEQSKDIVEDACLVYNQAGQTFLVVSQARAQDQLSIFHVSSDGRMVRAH